MAGARIRIVDLHLDDEKRVNEVAILMMDAFSENPNYCPDLEATMEEVRDLFEPGHIGRMAVDEQGTVLGVIGGQPHYYGQAWELHPLAVHPEHQRKGIGRALIADLEQRVRERGALTLFLGTDDEDDPGGRLTESVAFEFEHVTLAYTRQAAARLENQRACPGPQFERQCQGQVRAERQVRFLG